MFEDRRAHSDRRTRRVRDGIPNTGCRREFKRRNILRQYQHQPWWLQTNYAEEQQPPLLDAEAHQESDLSTKIDCG